MIEPDEIAMLDGSLFPAASYEARKDTRTPEQMAQDIGGGTERQNSRIASWTRHINDVMGDVVHIEILALAKEAIVKGNYCDPGDAQIKMTLFGETKRGRLEDEATPGPSDCYRIKHIACRKCDKRDDHILLNHIARDKTPLWRLITTAECRVLLANPEQFVTNDPWFRGKHNKPNGPFGGNPEKRYVVLWQKDALWVNTATCEPKTLCLEYLKMIFAKLNDKC